MSDDGLLVRWRKRRKPSIKDLLAFFRQIRRFHRAGITHSEALRVIHGQCTNLVLKNVIYKMVIDLDRGVRFSDSMAKFPDIFPKLCVHTINAGEESGTLDDVFEEILIHFEQKAEVDRQMKAGLFPVKVFSAIASIAICLAIFVVIPKFGEMFKGLKIELPGITKFVLGVGTFFSAHWFLVLLAAIAVVIGYKHFKKKYPERFDRLHLKIPIYSSLYYLELQYQFAKILSLVSRGVPIANSMQLTAMSINNIPIQKVLLLAVKHINNGSDAATAIEKSDPEKFISRDTLIMMRAGWQAGQLIETLGEISNDYRKDLLALTKTAGEKMGLCVIIPAMTILILVFGSVYFPVIKMMGSMTH